MAISKVALCNLALARIGTRSRITSIDEASTEAAALKTFFDAARDQVLNDHPWNFATKRQALAESAIDPPADWTYRYDYPTDCVRARALATTLRNIDPPRFKVEANPDLASRCVLADEEDAILVYTARVTDTNLFDPAFVVALSWRLAADIAETLSGDRPTADRCEQAYLRALATAKAADAGEQQPELPRDAGWIEGRE